MIIRRHQRPDLHTGIHSASQEQSTHCSTFINEKKSINKFSELRAEQQKKSSRNTVKLLLKIVTEEMLFYGFYEKENEIILLLTV